MHKPFRSIHLSDSTQLLNGVRKGALSKISCGLIGLLSMCWLTSWAPSHQLSADDPPPKLTLPPAQAMLPPQLPPPSPRSENNQRQIVDHLRRAISGDAEVEPSGDVVLDSIIDQLRSKGSVLQGSVLDPHEPASPQAGAQQLGAQQLGAQQLGAQQAQPPSEQACLVAEQLLRSARMLSQLEDHTSDPARRQLIDQLRHQAARLLTPPQPTN